MKTVERLLIWGLPVYIFLLPWQARRILGEYSFDFPVFGGMGFYITDGLFVLLLLLWVAYMIGQYKNKTLNLSKKQRLLLSAGFLFVGYTAIASYWSPNDLVAGYFWDRIIQAWFIMAMIVTLRIRLRVIFVSLLAAALLQSLVALQQFFIQGISANKWLGMAAQDPATPGVSVIQDGEHRVLRAYGMLPHPNMLGGFLSLGALIASAWYFDIYSRMKKTFEVAKSNKDKAVKKMRIEVILSLGSFVLIVTGLLLTFSRSAWLGFGAAWFLMFLLYLRGSKQPIFILWGGAKLIVVGLLVLGFLTVMFGPLWTSRLADDSRVAQISTTERGQLAEQSKKIIKENWLGGIGPAGYLPELMQKEPGKQIFEYQPVHNVWLLLWAELGVVGLGLFILWVVYIFYLLHHLWKKEAAAKLSTNQILILSAMFSIGLMAYFDHFWWTLAFGVLVVAVWLGAYVKEGK